MRSRRWPDWVYGSGEEPDYRFSFANERTFLAWIRTAVALVAAGVALDAFRLTMHEAVQRGLAAGLVAAGFVCAVAAWIRWATAERAMRRGAPLPVPHFSLVLAAGLAVAALVLLATIG